MARCFANINGITSRTNKFIYHTRTERPGHTILNRNQVFNFKRRKCQFDIKIFTILFSEHAYLTLGKIRNVKKWQFKINSGSIISIISTGHLLPAFPSPLSSPYLGGQCTSDSGCNIYRTDRCSARWLSNCTLVDRAYKINTTLAKFNEDVKSLLQIFKRNQYSESLINRVVKSYLNNAQTFTSTNDTSTIYFKLPFLNISNFTQRKVRMLAKKYCKNLNIKLAFSSFKIKNLITVKDCVPRSLRSCVVYKFICAGCNSVYIGETSRHVSTRVREHLFTDKNSHIFKHLKSSSTCKDACGEGCFRVLDSASSHHNLRIKEALHIMWERPNLNKQLNHYNVSLNF